MPTRPRCSRAEEASSQSGTRGRKGGIRLGKPASKINLGAIVRRTESDLALVPCFDDGDACPIGACCALTSVLREALAAFLDVLDRYTLADLMAPRKKLADLLGLQGVP